MKKNITRKSRQTRLYRNGFLIGLIFIILLFYLTDYVANEGFNPTDDGVILAQAHRILNGQIPHKDFISIRPVLSGVLHTIHFFSPFPLEESARIFVIFQFYVYSFLWILVLLNVFEIRLRSILYLISLLLFAFFLNMNIFILFPWTTIDGIFWATIGLFFLHKGFAVFKGDDRRKNLLCISLALLFMSFSALSRQSFITLPIMMSLFIAFKLITRNRIRNLLVILLVGSSPFILYLLFLIYTDSFSAFINQMTGRSEIFQTGVVRYKTALFTSKLLWLHGLLLLLIVYRIFQKTKGASAKSSESFSNISKKHLSFTKGNIIFYGILFLYLLATLIFSFASFFYRAYFDLPFEFFWILFGVGIVSFLYLNLNLEQGLVLLLGLLIAWSSSISLGANSPFFATGLMASIILILIAVLFQKLRAVRSLRARSVLYKIGIVLFSALFIIVALKGQRDFNYRDLPSNKLTKNLGNVIEGFGNIKTNPRTYNYYVDFIHLYNTFNNVKDHFVLLPNNAIIYALLRSKNPFPLDWMHSDEYVGAKEQFLSQIIDVLDNQKIYLFIDKYDSRYLASTLRRKNYNSYLYRDYMKLILNRCKKIESPSKYFVVYTNF